ncbi:MAG: flagellar basal-body MS-ring/collar protein FliF [candidate division FCPU426 bacterium]
MNEYFRQLMDQFNSAWQRFNAVQKTIVVLIPALLLAGLMTLVFWSSRPKYRTLYSRLTPKDAGVLVDKLKSDGVPYRIGGDGTTIEVSEDKVYETRLALASQNLPMGSGVGFEIFDKTSFGITDFNQQVNYQRALEGELERTLGALDEVERPRVHLVLPKPSLYESKQRDATASVLLTMKSRASLRADQIRGVVSLVAASVEGLDKKNVTVVDSFGTVLSDVIKDELADEANPTPGAISGTRLMKEADSQLQVQKQFEHEIERRVSGMLDKVLGPNRAAIRVSAELNFDHKEQNSEIYEPVVNNQGIVRSSQRKLESSSGVSTLPGGIPGTESNIPGYQNYAAAAGNSNYTRNEETTNYEINKKVARIIEAPGTVKRVSVAVMVDSLQPQQIDSIRAAVIAAAGLDLIRGDQVAVENISFDTSFNRNQQLAQVQAEKQELWTNLMKGVFVLLLVIFLQLVLRSILKPRVVRVQERLIREIGRGEAEPPAEIEMDPAVAAAAAEEQRKAELRQQVANLAREKPQAIALLIRRWLSEEKA